METMTEVTAGTHQSPSRGDTCLCGGEFVWKINEKVKGVLIMSATQVC